MSAVGTKLLLIFPNNFIEEYEHSDFIWEVTYSSMSLGKWEVKRMKLRNSMQGCYLASIFRLNGLPLETPGIQGYVLQAVLPIRTRSDQPSTCYLSLTEDFQGH